MEEQIQETEVVKEGLGSLTPQGGNAMTSIQNAANPGVSVVPNLIEAQDMAKNLSKVQLIQYAVSPQPDVIPAYIVTGELMRRKTAREKAQAKAPDFTVAQEVVAEAEQGLMNQMQQQQASNMPAGGYAPPREEVTREQIMEKGIAPLPNPGNAMGQGGMAQGGIIGFAGEEGSYVGKGAYMPQVKGKGAIADLLRYQDPVNPRNRPGLYQDFNLDQGPGMSMEDYQVQEEAILGPDRSSRIEDLQSTFITPFDEQISKVETQIAELNPYDTEFNAFDYASSMNPGYGDSVKLREELAALKQQRGLYFDDMSDAQIKQRRELGVPTGDKETVKVAESLTDKGGKITDKESVDESSTDKDGKITDKTTVEEDFSFTRLNPEEEADAAIEYARKALGDDPSLATINEKLMKIQEDRAERFAKDRNMNVSEAFFKASREAAKPGGINVGNIISAGGSPFIEGKRRIDEAEEKAAMGDFGVESNLATAAQARRDKLAGRGVDAYTTSLAYNRALEQKERADATTRRGQDLDAERNTALDALNYRINRDDKKDARQLIQDEIKIEKDVLKGEIGNLPPEVLVYANIAIRPGMSEKKVELIKKSKEIVKQEVAKYIQRVRGQNTQIASNTVDYSSLN